MEYGYSHSGILSSRGQSFQSMDFMPPTRKEISDGMLLPECQDYQDAVKLDIEALKRCKYISEHTDRWAGVLLPGETEE